MNKVANACKTSDSNFDFNTIMPTPDYIYQGELGQEEKELYSENNWYDWNRKHWGTKWNAYNVEIDVNANEIVFCTAWSMPESLFQAFVKKFADVDFEWKWADEEIGNDNLGKITCNNGKINMYIPEIESQEAFNLYVEVQGGENGSYT